MYRQPGPPPLRPLRRRADGCADTLPSRVAPGRPAPPKHGSTDLFRRTPEAHPWAEVFRPAKGPRLRAGRLGRLARSPPLALPVRTMEQHARCSSYYFNQGLVLGPFPLRTDYHSIKFSWGEGSSWPVDGCASLCRQHPPVSAGSLLLIVNKWCLACQWVMAQQRSSLQTAGISCWSCPQKANMSSPLQPKRAGIYRWSQLVTDIRQLVTTDNSCSCLISTLSMFRSSLCSSGNIPVYSSFPLWPIPFDCHCWFST